MDSSSVGAKRASEDSEEEDRVAKRISPSLGEESGDPKDSLLNAAGSSCHQCKSRRNYADLIFCTNVVDKKNKTCRKKYCESCLRKFYREDAPTLTQKASWTCPSCRKLCCCAACRRKDQKDKAPMQLQYDNYPHFPHAIQGTPLTTNPPQDSSAKSSFALLYAVAQIPSVQKLISEVLFRKDLSDSEKVESIANLLRGAVAENSASVSSKQNDE